MSESPSNGQQSGRMDPPFPSRKDLHRTRIPRRPAGAPEMPETPKAPSTTPVQNHSVTTGSTRTVTDSPNTQIRTVSISGKQSSGIVDSSSNGSQIDSSTSAIRPPVDSGIVSKSSTGSSSTKPSFTTPKNNRTVSINEDIPSEPKSRIREEEVSSSAITFISPTGTAQNTVSVSASRPDSESISESTIDQENLSDFESVLSPESTGLRSRRLESKRSEAKKRKKRRRRGWRAALIVLLVLVVVGGAAWWAVTNLSGPGLSIGSTKGEDYPGPGSGSVEVVVEPGDLGTDIGRRLYESGVVKSVEAFTAEFNANKASSSIKPGTYTLMKEMSAAKALAYLLDDANRSDNTITVIPGQTVTQVKEKLIEIGGFSSEDVDAALADTDALGLPAEANGSLEGWLWAGSYEAGANDTPTAVLSSMVKKTVDFLESQNVPKDQWETVLIKSSIVEREVNSDDYMPQVARVIENRLSDTEGETRGKLGMDSTVSYGVGRTSGIPTADDTADDNPYNTYIYAGLPPTPIASPSQAAIEAVLNPAEGDWLYFVTVNLDSGETLFSNTLEEQQKNTLLLTKWCSDNPGKC